MSRVGKTEQRRAVWLITTGSNPKSSTTDASRQLLSMLGGGNASKPPINSTGRVIGL